MARIRSVKPEYWTDLKLARLSRDARLLYISLWNQADEHGRLHGDPRYVKGHCLPYDDDLTLRDVDRLLAELERAGRLVRYEVEGDPFLHLPNLHKHQRLEPGKVASRLPEPPSGDDRPTPPATRMQPETFDSAPRATSSERRADSSEKTVALHVAGSRLQVAGEHGESETPRPDVAALCGRLVDRMVRNGCAKPRITKAWTDAARLLLDKDDRPLDDALSLLDWSQQHTFWRSNIQSLPTFREKYDQLRLQRDRDKPTHFGVGYGDADREGPSRVMTGSEWATETPRSSA